MEILDLPEIREVILSHLDAESRKEAVLVCLEFYEIICHQKSGLEIDDKLSFL